MSVRVSSKSRLFTESVIREMTRKAAVHGAINLSQGFPDFGTAPEIKQAAAEAVQADLNQYSITWGAKSFRDAVAAKTQRYLGMQVNPETELTVTCGATEAMISTMLALLDPGDEVVIFEPFYENYGPDAIVSGAVPRFVQLRPPDWRFDAHELEAAINQKTRAVVLNTPNNPTGKVFTRAELEQIAALCKKHDVLVFTDEIYEHILYDGAQHVCIATLPGMRERTVIINSLSKTYSVTGWRVGYAIAPPFLTDAIRKVHDFMTVGAPAPLQEAGVRALSLPQDYYTQLREAYRQRRDLLIEALEAAGFRCWRPRGAYYVMTDISEFGFPDDRSFADFLVRDIGIAVVPGGSFFSRAEDGAQMVRFCFPKKFDTLDRAARRLEALPERLAAYRRRSEC